MKIKIDGKDEIEINEKGLKGNEYLFKEDDTWKIWRRQDIDYEKIPKSIEFITTPIIEDATNDDFCIEEEYEECLQEIKRLNNDIKILLKENENKEKVILKYDNIINELDTFLKNKIDNFDKTASDNILHEQMVIEVIYGYIQELKERK